MAPLEGPTAASYEVFYQLKGEIKNVSGGNANNTELTLTGLTLGTYSIFVVNYGVEGEPVLPSDPTNITIITIGKFNQLTYYYYHNDYSFPIFYRYSFTSIQRNHWQQH